MLATNLKIFISDTAYKKIFHWTFASNLEVGFMGVTEFDSKQSAYIIHDVFLPKQEVSGATTDLDADAMAQLEFQALTLYPDLHLNAWIHSHVDMQVFWSGTDRATIEDMGKNGLCVAVVVNQKKEMRGAIRVNNESNFYPSFFLDDIPVERLDMVEVDTLKEWDEQFKDCVRKKEFNYPKITPETNVAKTMNLKERSFHPRAYNEAWDDYHGFGPDIYDEEPWFYTEHELSQMTKAELEGEIDYWSIQHGMTGKEAMELRDRFNTVNKRIAK